MSSSFFAFCEVFCKWWRHSDIIVQLFSRGMWFRGKDLIAFVMDLQIVSKTNTTLDEVFTKKFMFSKSISRG